MSSVAAAAAAAAAGGDDDNKYECRLDAETEKKAIKELNEDPKDRLNAVQALRTWIRQQPHLTFRTETSVLLYFLRTAKFSQLRAREIIENNARAFTLNPQWLRDVDSHDPRLQEVFDSGYMIPLPKRDRNGSFVMIYRVGARRKDGHLFTVQEELHATVIVSWLMALDENVQVNGLVFIMDMTGFTAKHMTRWSMDDMKRWSKCWQNAMPGRFKAFHHYNAGTIFETIMSISRPFLSKKIQERIYVHETLESLYKCVDMDILPTEYLPDDYQGPSSGPIAEIIDKVKRDILAPEFRAYVLDQSNERSYGLDESKRPNYKPVNESFRKLAID